MKRNQVPIKHKPVLLQEVISEFEKLIPSASELVAIDCTVGQAGHSIEIFKKLEKGVLLSIDKYKKTIEWVSSEYKFRDNELIDGQKKWKLINNDFALLDEILDENGLSYFDFLLADLGFSNFQIRENLGISYSNLSQKLDMRYGDQGLKASEFLNNTGLYELQKILTLYSQIEEGLSERIAKSIINARKNRPYEYVGDLVSAIKGFGHTNKIKVFQALRSYINQEPEKLKKLLEIIKSKQSINGTSLIISFNKLEERIIDEVWGEHEVKEPNITEMIINTQSRSAKLHIYKQKFNRT